MPSLIIRLKLPPFEYLSLSLVSLQPQGKRALPYYEVFHFTS